MKKITTLVMSSLMALTICSAASARTVHQTNVSNYFLGTLTIGVTLYTGTWQGKTCNWQHAYPLTNFNVKMTDTYVFKLDSKTIQPFPLMTSPTCGELRFVTNHGVQESDKFKILLDGKGTPQGTDPDTVSLKFFG